MDCLAALLGILDALFIHGNQSIPTYFVLVFVVPSPKMTQKIVPNAAVY